MRLKDVDLPKENEPAVINRMAHSGGRSWAQVGLRQIQNRKPRRL